MCLLTYSDFINDRQPAIRIVSTVAWQNVLLSYNLMSATIPSLKGFTKEFMTAGVSLGYAREGGTTGASGTQRSYELQSLKRSNMSSKVSPLAKDGSWCCHEESASIISHDSQKIMIKQEWTVSTE
jgi:hypothetical protein